MENDPPIYVNNTQIENVESHIYVRQRYSTRDKDQDKDIQRRITATSSRVILGQVYNSCVLLAMAYGEETWTLTTQAKNKLEGAQTKIERSMLKGHCMGLNLNISC